MLSEEPFVWWTSLCSFPCLPVFSDATTSSTPAPMQSLHHSFVPTLVVEIFGLNSESWLHNPPIRVQSNGLGARWTDHHPTTLIIRSCTSNQWIQQFTPPTEARGGFVC